MFKIFGRSYPGTHPLEHPLRALLERQAGTGDGDAAVAFNIVDDHRVPGCRERLLLKSLGSTDIAATKFKDDFKDFFKSNIRFTQTPDFILPVNAENRVPIRTGFEGDGLQPGLSLVRLLDLSGLVSVYGRHTRHKSGQFTGLERDPAKFPEWLDGKCDAVDPAKEEFIRATLDMLNTDRKVRPYQPVWAALWDEFSPYLSHPAGATRWRQALGLKPQTSPRWYAVLKYTAGEVGSLYRPTQIDADWNCYHAPSPGSAPVWRGGCTMDCRGECVLPLSEYVHQQIDHEPEHWTSAGRLVGLDRMNDTLGFQEQRRRHHELLVSHFGEAARRWRC